MKRRFLRWLVIVVASAILLFGWVYTRQMVQANEPLATALTPGEGETIIGVRPPDTVLFLGDTFSVTIYIQDVGSGLSAAQFDLEYDPAILQVATTGTEPFLQSTGRNVYCPPFDEVNAGVIRIACASSGAALGPVGTGDVIEFTFKAVGAGISPLTLSNSLLVDDSLAPASITAVEVSGQVEIQGEPQDQYTLFLPMITKDGTPPDQGFGFATFSATNDLYTGATLSGSAQEGIDRASWSTLGLAVFTVFSIVTMADPGGIKKTALTRLKKTSVMLPAAGSYQAIYRTFSTLVVASMLLSLIKPILPAQATPATQRGNAGEQTAEAQDPPQTGSELASSRNRPGRHLPEELPADLQDYLANDTFWADIDGDRDVDTADMTSLAEIWNCQLGDDCFAAELDFQADDRIDAWDLAWIGNHYDVDPPEIAINTPAADAVVGQPDVQVGGILTDTHEVISVTVNNQQAVLVGSAFSATVPLAGGQQLISVVATDALGQTSARERIVNLDGSGPMLEIHQPLDRQSVYTLNPTVVISYTDFYTGVDTTTLNATLADELGTETDVTADLSILQDGAIGTLTTPLAADESYTLTVSVADNYGNLSTESVSFYVPVDPASIVTPARSVGSGWVSGVVYDSSTCDTYLTGCDGLPGAWVTLAYSGGLSLEGSIVTGPDGFFAFPVPETNHYWLRVEKDSYTYGQRPAAIVLERSTGTNNIYLTPIDPVVSLCDDTGCNHVGSDGDLKVDIPPGAIASGQQVTVTATIFDQVEFLPSGELPEGTWETYAFNLGGDSDVAFSQPITVSQRNTIGFDPGTEIPLGYWNQDTMQWEHKGFGVVDPSGEWVVMHIDGFSNYDINFPISTPDIDLDADVDDETEDDDEPGADETFDDDQGLGDDGSGDDDSDRDGSGSEDGEEDCNASEPGCTINVKSGTIKESYTLPAVNAAGRSVAPILLYNSSRAQPSEVIDLKVTLSVPEFGYWEDYASFTLYIEGLKTDEFWFDTATLYTGGGRLRYLWDGRDAQGNLMAPGIYNFRVELRTYYNAQYCGADAFGGVADCVNRPTDRYVRVSSTTTTKGTVELDTEVDNPWGNGWTLSGLQRLYETEEGKIMIADGLRRDTFNFPLMNKLLGEQENQGPVLPPLDAYPGIQLPTAEMVPFLALPPAEQDLETQPDHETEGSAHQQQVTDPTGLDLDGIVGLEEGDGLSQDLAPAVAPPQRTVITPAPGNRSAYITKDSSQGKLVAGLITTDTLWTAGTYILTETLTIASGGSLTLEPGVIVQFASSSVDLVVEGALDALGNDTTAVVFQPQSGTNPGSWGRVAYLPGSSGTITYATFEYGGSTDGMLYIDSDDVVASNATVRYSANSGIVIPTASPTVSSTQVLYNKDEYGAGVYIGSGSPTIVSSTIQYNTGDVGDPVGAGIYVDTGQPLISSNVVANNTLDIPSKVYYAGSYGGGIFINAGSPRIEGNLIQQNQILGGNWDVNNGGGIYNVSGSPMISANTIITNTAFRGGGIYLNAGDSTVLSNTISGNDADVGGGIYAYSGRPLIQGNLIRENRAVDVAGSIAHEGGGIYSYSAIPTLMDNFFGENSATYGGAIFNQTGGALVEASEFVANHASTRGGAIWDGGSIRLFSSLFASNTAGQGGAVWLDGYYPRVEFNTFWGNHANNRGGAIGIQGAYPQIVGNIIANNSVNDWNAGGIFNHTSFIKEVYFPTEYNNVWNNTGGNYTGLIAGPTDISANPLFVDPTGGDFRLQVGSLAIDAVFGREHPQYDVDGNPRPMGSAPDMGAYEFTTLGVQKVSSADTIAPGQIYTYTTRLNNQDNITAETLTLTDVLPGEVSYLAHQATDLACSHSGEPQGGSVSCSLASLPAGQSSTLTITVQAATTLPSPVTITNTISVTTANGLAASDQEATWLSWCRVKLNDGPVGTDVKAAIAASSDPADTVKVSGRCLEANISINKGLTLQGGWNYAFTELDPATYHTTLDAKRWGRVLHLSGTGPVTVENFTITGGGTATGAGLYLTGGDFIVQNNIIRDNITYVDANGGGIYHNSGNSKILGNVFINNRAGLDGGAIYSNTGNPLIAGNTFNANSANRYGGAIYANYHKPTIDRNYFVGNRAGDLGGAITSQHAGAIIQNNLFIDNSTFWNTGSGGAIANGTNTTVPDTDGKTHIRFNTFVGNSAYWKGGAIYNWNGLVRINHNIIVSNTAAFGGGIYHSEAPGLTFLQRNDVWNNQASDSGNNYYNTGPRPDDISEDPLFVDPAAGNYRLSSGSPVIDLGELNNQPAKDIVGNIRPMGLAPDLGAFEFETLGVVAEAGQETVLGGETLAYAITVTNHADSTATNLSLEQLLTAEQSYLDYQGDGISCSHHGSAYGGSVNCSLGDIQSGNSKALSLTLLISNSIETPVQLVNTVDVSSTNGLVANDVASTWVSWCNVKRNDGAIGHDLQAAVDASNNPADVIKISGRCVVNDINIEKTLRLQGGWNSDFSHFDPESYRTILDAEWQGRVLDIGTNSADIRPVIEHLELTGGFATTGAAIDIYIYDSAAIIDNNIHHNVTSVSGSGINIDREPTNITNNVIRNNLIHHNWTKSKGSAMHLDGSTTVVNNTVVENIGPTGSIYHKVGSPVIQNNIIVSNTVAGSSGNAGIYHASSGVVNMVDYNIIWGNTGDQYVSVYPGANNLSVDPLFVDPPAGNYRLSADSPGLSIANPEYAPNQDIEDAPRPMGLGSDMGAYERHTLGIRQVASVESVLPGETVVYQVELFNLDSVIAESLVVTSTLSTEFQLQSFDSPELSCTSGPLNGITCLPASLAPGETTVFTVTAISNASLNSPALASNTVLAQSNNGLAARNQANTWITWCNAQLNNGAIGNNLQAAINASSQATDIVKVSGRCLVHDLTLNKSLTLQGGWNADFSQYDPEIHETTLDAQRLGRILSINGSVSPIIENLTFVSGVAAQDGGAIYSASANLTIRNSNFIGNIENKLAGGAIYNGSGDIELTGNLFLGNISDIFGGALYNNSGNVTVESNVFARNYSNNGGGIYLENGTLTILQNYFIENAADSGGAVRTKGTMTLKNNILAFNQAWYGGAVHAPGESFNISYNTFYGNGATTSGAVLYSDYGNKSRKIHNNIIVSNTIDSEAAIRLGGSLYSLNYNVYYGNSGGDFNPAGISPGASSIFADPLLSDPANYDFHLLPGSPAIDAANMNDYPDTDFEGDLRYDGQGPDIGADEQLVNNPSSQSETDHSELIWDTGKERYIRIYPNGLTIFFRSDGLHDYTEEPDGRKTVYKYDENGYVTDMEIFLPGQESAGWTWTMVYEEDKVTITDPAGRPTVLVKNRHNQLTEIDGAEGDWRSFGYNQDDLMTQHTDAGGNISTIEYDENGRVKMIVKPLKPIRDSETGITTMDREKVMIKSSDSNHGHINGRNPGNSDAPGPPLKESELIIDEVEYESGSFTGRTNKFGYWLEKTDALSRTITFERDSANNLLSVDYPDGSCDLFSYDALGNMLTYSRKPVTQCGTITETVGIEPSQAVTWTYAYEERFNKTKTVTDPLNNTTTFTYDYEEDLGTAGNLVRIEYPAVEDPDEQLVVPTVHFGYNALGLLDLETDEMGVLTKYIYSKGTVDEFYGHENALFAEGVAPVPGLLTQVIRDYGGLNQTTYYLDFDRLGNPQRVIGPTSQDVLIGAPITFYKYDGWNRLVREENALGIVTRFEYDARDNLTKMIQDYTPDGLTGRNIQTTYSYDMENRVVGERTSADGIEHSRVFQYDVNGNLVAETDANGNTTTYTYNVVNQLVSSTNPLGHTTGYGYSSVGLLEATIWPDGTFDKNVYDDAGNLVEEILDFGGLNITSRYIYNENDNILTEIDPTGVETCYQYDSNQRQISETRDCGGRNLTTEYAYQPDGVLVRTIDPRGVIDTIDYDALGRRVMTHQDQGALDFTTEYVYDIANNLIQVIDNRDVVNEMTYDTLNQLVQMCQDVQGLNRCFSYTYDQLGNRTTTEEPNGSITFSRSNAFGKPIIAIQDFNGLHAATSYFYDDALNVTGIRDSNGNLTNYLFDSNNQTISELLADGTSRSFQFDSRGRVIESVDQSGVSSAYGYDRVGWLTDKTISGDNVTVQQFEYDQLGRMTRAAQTDSVHDTEIVQAYDALGAVVSTTQTLDDKSWQVTYTNIYTQGLTKIGYPSGIIRVQEFDGIGRPVSIETNDGTAIASYIYDDQANNYDVAYANGVTNHFEFDSLGRTIRVSSPIADYRYAYDANDNMLYQQRWDKEGKPADVFEYDALRQLNRVWYAADATSPGNINQYESTVAIQQDVLSNRLEVDQDGQVESYSPNDGTRLTNPMNRYEEAGGKTFGYDLNGNMLDDGANSYTYDSLNRLVSVNNALYTAEYIYDALGRRVAKEVNGETTYYIYESNFRVLEEEDKGGALVARYTYGQGIDEPLTIEHGGNIYYYHRNALGNITEITNSAGSVVESYRYDAFGMVTIFDQAGVEILSSTVGNKYLFSGRRYDPESGNYYFRYRYYHPKLGRFLQMDPAGNIDGMNRYNAYFIMAGADPFGLFLGSVTAGCSKTVYGFQCGYSAKRTIYLWFAEMTVKLDLNARYNMIFATRQKCKSSLGQYRIVTPAPQTNYNPLASSFALTIAGGIQGPGLRAGVQIGIGITQGEGPLGHSMGTFSRASMSTSNIRIWYKCHCYQMNAQLRASHEAKVYPARIAVVAVSIATVAGVVALMSTLGPVVATAGTSLAGMAAQVVQYLNIAPRLALGAL